MIMHSEQYKYLRFISFQKLSQWYVEYYLNALLSKEIFP